MKCSTLGTKQARQASHADEQGAIIQHARGAGARRLPELPHRQALRPCLADIVPDGRRALGGDDNLDLDLSFELNSRLLIAQWANDKDECKLEFFDWDRNEAKLLDTKILGRKDVCLSRHASDPVAANEPVKNLPAEFIGGWIQISAEITQCPSPTSGDLFITQRGFKEYGEDECGVDSVKAFPNSTVVRVDFDCGGEGQSWHSEEIMYVGDLGKIKVLVMTSLGSTDNRDDFGKPMPPEPDDGNPQVSVYLKCQ